MTNDLPKKKKKEKKRKKNFCQFNFAKKNKLFLIRFSTIVYITSEFNFAQKKAFVNS